jgi:hypothetical protein
VKETATRDIVKIQWLKSEAKTMHDTSISSSNPTRSSNGMSAVRIASLLSRLPN